MDFFFDYFFFYYSCLPLFFINKFIYAFLYIYIYINYLQVADLKIALFTRYWTVFNYLAIYLTSIIFYFAFVVACENLELS